jgi:uncharacterized damage-inducible protein DinB
MNYYAGQELAASFRTVRRNTLTIAGDIPEERYGFRPARDCRSVAQTLVHIALAPRLAEQIHFIEHRTSLAGFDFLGLMDSLLAEENTPRTKAQIVELLTSGGERFADLLETADERFLATRVVYPAGIEPPSKTRFEMLLNAKEHEMHHRGQLMVVERMIGIVPHLTRGMEQRVAAMRAGR